MGGGSLGFGSFGFGSPIGGGSPGGGCFFKNVTKYFFLSSLIFLFTISAPALTATYAFTAYLTDLNLCYPLRVSASRYARIEFYGFPRIDRAISSSSFFRDRIKI